MSVSTGSPQSGGSGGLDSNAEVNLAPIIDFLIVLITYLLAAASFITLGGLGAGVADIAKPSQNSDTSSTPNEPPKNVTVRLEIKQGETFRVLVKGAESIDQTLPIGNSPSGEFQEALKIIKDLKGRYPNLDSLTLTADDSVPYERIIKAVAQAKKELPIFFIRAEGL